VLSNAVKVIICGKEYTLKTTESPNHVYELARVLERRINQNMEKNPSTSQYAASILVALQLLDDLCKSKERNENVEEQAKAYVNEAGRSRIERDQALRKIEELNARISQLETELKIRQNRGDGN